MADVQLAPLRPIGDFLLESARFQIPNVKDPEKWANRVLNNLLYYQTNYFLTALLVFLLIGIVHPVQMVCGFIAISVAFGGFVYCTSSRWKARRFKRDHPIISVIVILLSGYLLVYMVGAVIVFMFGIAFPLLLILMHASFRMRSIKNKVTNRLETVGLKRTPMGIILEGLGQDQEPVS
ncbi:PRA1 family protein 3-like [Ruditapes philippinarum]|uniref:PRA1 family protein 3-like n=1 Tax=Ruditapes philippinarum TaxID=129788 RepID=UPI00295AF337|nr:PRA1 family protein 3-like [Ruditapes philippinarum]